LGISESWDCKSNVNMVGNEMSVFTSEVIKHSSANQSRAGWANEMSIFESEVKNHLLIKIAQIE
jgi:hypothetical protein